MQVRSEFVFRFLLMHVDKKLFVSAVRFTVQLAKKQKCFQQNLTETGNWHAAGVCRCQDGISGDLV